MRLLLPLTALDGRLAGCSIRWEASSCPLQALFANENLFTSNTRLFVMPRERSLDIDSQADFEMVEWMMTKGLK